MPPRRRRQRFAYDERAARYGIAGPGGRFVSRKEIRGALDATLTKASDATQALTDRLARREISVAEWQVAMAREVKSAHLASVAAARGGFGNLSPADYGRAGRIIRDQYDFLRKWAADIASGKAPLDGRARLRSRWYIQRARHTLERETGRVFEARGNDEVRSRRHARDSCAGSAAGCVEQAAMSWQPIGGYVWPGDRICRAGCLCTTEFRNSATGAVAA